MEQSFKGGIRRQELAPINITDMIIKSVRDRFLSPTQAHDQSTSASRLFFQVKNLDMGDFFFFSFFMSVSKKKRMFMLK